MTILGMIGNGDWNADMRPKNWRQQILKLYPNGQTPLTAILSMMKSESVDDPEFYWWTQTQSAVSGAVIDIFTDPGLTTSYVSGGLEDDILYVVMLNAAAERIRPGHEILLRDASDYRVDTVGKVVDLARGATNTALTVKLLEDDTNAGTNDLSDCDNFKIIGNINAEGAVMPIAVALEPDKVYNNTQIFRTPLSITRTARKTRLRTGDQYQKAKSEALEIHSWEMELAYISGIRTEKIGDNGKPERTTMGILPFIKDKAPTNCSDFTLDGTGTWAANGEAWFKDMLEKIFRYGADEKLCLCGSGFLLGIDALAMSSGQVNIQPAQKTYGMQIQTWITPFGSLHMKTHPLFSHDTVTRNMGMIIEPKELTNRFIDDTTFFGESSNKQHSQGNGAGRVDGTDEEYLTESGLEFGLAQKCGILNGVGLDVP